MRELENTVTEVNKDVETIQERRAALKAEIHVLENDKLDIENEIKQKEQKAKDRILPEIQRTNDLILKIKMEMELGKERIAKEEA